MTDWAIAEGWLQRIKQQNRSSPASHAWAEFWRWLQTAAPRARTRPPMPLILGASGEPAANKHQRLGMQLRWAQMHDILPQAIRWPDACPIEKWETTPPSDWNASFYPSFNDYVAEEGDDET